MEIAVQRTPLSRIRLVLRALGAFAGLVTGVFWMAALAPAAFGPGSGSSRLMEYAGSVLTHWTSTVVPSLVIAGLHYYLTQGLGARFGTGRARGGSALLALAAWPAPLADRDLWTSAKWWGIPLALMLLLYGWYRGGMVATEGRGTPADRAIERTGIGIAAVLVLGFIATVGWAWSAAMLRRG
jgi:hypothetical protein